ncbi:MAG: cell division protein FtsZ [Verrucomicrobiota bacterium]
MNHSPELNSPALDKKISIKVFGVGGAGCNATGFMARQPFPGVTLVAMNTDAQSLADCAVPEKFCLGAALTHGLGAGGDPEVGRAAAEGDFDTLREFCKETEIVFIVAGLGGGTGTGASSVIARAAKDSGALVLGIVTMPFDFEGGRRQRQAQLGLQQIKSAADAVICLPNQKVFKLIDAKTTVLNTFNVTNELLSQGVFGISRLLTRTGLINVDFADLASATRNSHSESSFATAEATGEKRAQQIVEKLFAHPMLENGQLLGESESILVSLVGGGDLTIAEVNEVMEEINGRCENASIVFGAIIDETFSNRLSVTLVASGKGKREEKTVPAPRANPRATHPTPPQAEPDSQLLDPAPASRPASRLVAPAPEMSDEKKGELLMKQAGGRARKPSVRMRQKELGLELVSKGRFAKSEPTIHRGEDLDMPTYMRRGILMN